MRLWRSSYSPSLSSKLSNPRIGIWKVPFFQPEKSINDGFTKSYHFRKILETLRTGETLQIDETPKRFETLDTDETPKRVETLEKDESIRGVGSQGGWGNRPVYLSKSELLSYIQVLKDCGQQRDLLKGKVVHGEIVSRGLGSHKLLGNVLITMYGRCGDLNASLSVFKLLHHRDVVSWNALIAANVQNGQDGSALRLFREMWHKGVSVNKVTFISALRACATPEFLADGRFIHSCIMDLGLEADTCVGTALVKMYGNCGTLKDACKVFNNLRERDLISWNAMIGVYSQQGDQKAAMELFVEMKRHSLRPDKITFVSLLNACSDPSALTHGKKIHGLLQEHNIRVDSTITNALINMYTKCGSLEDAERIFRVCQVRDVVSWNTMLTAYSQQGQSKAALELFRWMKQESVEIDNVTIVTILDACGDLANLEEGKQIHAGVLKKGVVVDCVLATALVNMYSKCAKLWEAQVVFDQVLLRDRFLWAAIIAAYAQHGKAEAALQFFSQMQNHCQKPDEITMIHILHACSHFGLLEEGLHFFSSIAENGQPVKDHYVCVVDLLGRVGQLQEAEDFIRCMPYKADAVIWTAFLSACRVHGDIDRGKKAAKILVEMDPHNAAPYVILSHMYTAAGRQKDAENVRRLITDRHVRKEPGQSWITIADREHRFVADDKSHLQKEEIYNELHRINKQLSLQGFTSDTNPQLHYLEDEGHKPTTIHSEKLAMVFGLISTPPLTTLHVFKNLRVCKDCHIFSKFLSKFTQRTIIERDAVRFHQFRNGLCSCGDYW